MVKINLLSTLVLALTFMAGTTNAQTKIWGAGAPVGAAEGEFSAPFVNAQTTGSYSTTAWTALSVYDGNANNAYWERNLTGYSSGAYWGGTTPMTSPSQANGVAAFESDFLDNGGVQNNFGLGTSPSPHRGELISPRIDLTGYTNQGLAVKFYTWYRDFDITTLGVAMSTDDGATWSTEVDWRPTVGNLVQAYASTLFATATQGVANLTQCRIKFIFDGDYYFALVDDVTIESAEAYQIGLGNADPASTLLVGNGNYVRVGSNRFIPLTSVDNLAPAYDLTEWFWGGKIVNYGTADILPSDSAAYHINIDFVDPTSGVITPSVYTDVMYFDTTVYGGNLSGQTGIEYFDNLDFIKTYGRGDYNVTYWVTHKNNTSIVTVDDTVKHVFTMTHNAGTLSGPREKHYLSKARLSTADGRVFATRGIAPATPPASMQYGCVFFFPRGATDVVTIDSVDFRYRLAAAYSGGPTQTLLLDISEMDAASSAVLDDGALLTQAGVALINLTDLGTTVALGAYGLHTAIPTDPISGGAMGPLKDNSFYYISIINNPLGTVPTMNANNVVQMGVDESNYYMNAAMTDVNAVINPSPLASTDGLGATTWYWTGFGADYLPSLGVYLSSASIVSTTTVFSEKGAELKVYPNPASNLLNINFKLDEASDVMYIITDMSGRVVAVSNSNNVTNDTQSIDVSNLASGVYMITAKTDKLSSTERFIKQ